MTKCAEWFQSKKTSRCADTDPSEFHFLLWRTIRIVLFMIVLTIVQIVCSFVLIKCASKSWSADRNFIKTVVKC